MIILYYLHLIKPGIVVGNVISSISSFIMASRGNIDYILLFNMSIGISLIIAASCVSNNIIDRDIDAIMMRTKNRVLTQSGTLSIKTSIIYAIILNIFGLSFLIFTKNLFTILLSIFGWFIYVIIYSLWIKRKSIYSTIIGSISGSMPPVIGYCTATNKFDIGALILLAMFSFWQIPHFYSITIFRAHDYKKAEIPTFFTHQGILLTKIHMNICILGFSLTTMLLSIIGYTSYIFLYITSFINGLWLYIGLHKNQSINNYILWAKKMFFLSIIIIMSIDLLLSIDPFFFKN